MELSPAFKGESSLLWSMYGSARCLYEMQLRACSCCLFSFFFKGDLRGYLALRCMYVFIASRGLLYCFMAIGAFALGDYDF